MRLLTQAELLVISRRIEDEAGPRVQEDMRALMAYAEALSDRLSDCWLYIDDVARVPESVRVIDQETRKLAEALLRRQGAPGWKETR